jgi:acetyl-CoA acyltransferase
MIEPRRVAIIAGCRTPFARAGTAFRDLTAVDLGKACVRELVEHTDVDPGLIGSLVMGQVIPSVKAPNLAREVGLGTGLPVGIPAYTVNRACASGNEAITEVAAAIARGEIDAGIAGGAESLSDVPILHSKGMARALVNASRAKSLGGKLRAFSRVGLKDLAPDTPAIAEPSTGLTMGQSAEKMAKENRISREEQDQIAFASHRNAADAIERGRLAGEMCAVMVPPRYEGVITADNLVRRDTSLEALAALSPVFDRKYGTVTAGNSSPLTDGAAAVLLMAEDRAEAEGYLPRAFIRSWAVAAVDPAGQLLMGPAIAIPLALERAGLKLENMDLIEMHEAFAAQVASNIQALESETWARDVLGRDTPVGKVDRSRLNVCGGSIAIGHPFGATGARLTTTLANELRRRGGRYGLLSVCAQGGMGFAMVIER